MKQKIKSSKILMILLKPIIKIRKLVIKDNADSFDNFYNFVFNNVTNGSLVVEAKDFHGEFEIDFRSHLLMRLLKYKDYESGLVSLVEKYLPADRDVIDVGANIGLFTVLFAKLISSTNKVLAIEPTPAALNLLESNIKRNHCNDKTIIHSGVASDSKEIIHINVIPGMEEYTSIAEIIHESAKDKKSESIEVNSNTLDSIVLKNRINPGFIKIDTEGSEYKVLKGAEEILTKYKPIILSELSEKLLNKQSASCLDVFSFLNNFGYNVLDAYSLKPVSNVIEGEIIAIPK